MAAYFVFHNRVLDPAKMQEYVPMALATLASHKHEIIAFDEKSTVIEGNTNLPRTVVVKFDSRDAAMAWYNSPEYQKALSMRLEASEGYAVLVEG